MQLLFGEWLPDQAEHLKKGANVATNVYYAQNTYKRFPSLVNYSSNNIGKHAKGAGSFRNNVGGIFNFVATKTDIWQLASGLFTSRKTGLTGDDTDYITFTQFGNHIISSNGVDTPQYYNMLYGTVTASKASCTITVTDYANIAVGTTITLKKNDGTSVVFTSEALGGTAPAGTNGWRPNQDNDTTADNIFTAINAHADFSAANPASGTPVVIVTRAVNGGDNGIVASSDTTRVAVTNFVGGNPVTQFTNLADIVTAGTLPVFRVSGVVRDFFVVGNITNKTNRIQWSGINDLATWTGKQSDYQDLPGSGGKIVHITSGEIGYVFRQNQIIRMDYVGGNVIFRLSVISPNRGAVYGSTVCQDNRQVFFYSDDGFYQLSGDSIIPIGSEKVNRYFDLNINRAYTDRIKAAVDPFNQLVMWAFPSKNTEGVTGLCDRIIIYNYATKKWSLAETKCSVIFPQFVGAYTVELMDIISENLDNINAALDTDYWNGGQMFLGAMDHNYKAAIFSGTSNICEVETDELEPSPGTRANILGVRPVVDANTTLTVKARERLADTVTETSSVSMVNSGINPIRTSGRYIRVNCKIPSGTVFTHAQGIDMVVTKAGIR